MPFPQAKDLGQPSREALWRSGTQISNHRRLLRARRDPHSTWDQFLEDLGTFLFEASCIAA